MLSQRGTRPEDVTAFERFRALHEGPVPFVMPNPWDGASAVLLKQAGFAALGSTSLGIAFSLGRQDGTHAVSRSEALANASLFRQLTGLPVNGDLEDGFGPEPGDCVATVKAAIEAGLAGLGIEDTTADPSAPIHSFDRAVARVRAAADAARGRILLTGRTDVMLHRPDFDDALARLVAFAEAGADVLYAPGLAELDEIVTVVRAVAPKPVNALVSMLDTTITLDDLTKAGVRRLSVGGALYLCTMKTVFDAAEALRGGDFRALSARLPSKEIAGLLPGAQ